MTNNDVFKKLRVALMLRDDDIIEILKLVDFKVSKSELGALFRKEDHPNYVECGDQILRNFLNGLVIHLRGTKESPKFPGDVLLKGSGMAKKVIPNPNKPSFKQLQRKKTDPGMPSIKYKNKPSQSTGKKKS